MPKTFNSKEFMEDLTKMVDQKLEKFKNEMESKVKPAPPVLTQKESIDIIASPKIIVDLPTRQALLMELLGWMRKWGLKEIMAKRKNVGQK